MRLVVCSQCETQYDVTSVADPTIPCRCGAAIKNEAPPGVDAKILRCGSCGAAVAEEARECGYCQAAIVRQGGAKSLICPKCFAQNADQSHFCTGCGLKFEPMAVAFAVDLVTCVAGCGAMAAQVVAGVSVQECTHCRGIWIPGHHLDDLVARSAEAGRGVDPHRIDAQSNGGALDPERLLAPIVYRKCPECSVLMVRKNFRRISGVVVDHCPEHGSWLDAHELEQLAEFARTGGLLRAVECSEKERLLLERSAAFRARIEAGTRQHVKHQLNREMSRSFVDVIRKFLS